MINRVILIGRLTRDPEPRKTTTGKNVVSFSIAVDRRFKGADGQDADFFRITAWGQLADFVSNYMTKGRLISVEGRLQQRKYTDNTGASRESYEVVADAIDSLDRPRDGSGSQGSGSSGNAGGSEPKVAETVPEDYDPFGDE